MKPSRIAARALLALSASAAVLLAGCGQRRVYYAPVGYGAPPVVVIHHGYGGYGAPPIVVHHYGGGYGAPPVVHVYHGGGYGGGFGGGRSVIVHHHY